MLNGITQISMHWMWRKSRKKYAHYGQTFIYVFKYESFPLRRFSWNVLVRQVFVQNFFTEFHEYSTKGLVRKYMDFR